MKKLYTLLLCALCVSVVHAVEITETYDFGSFITANGTGNLTVSGNDIAQSGTSAKVGNVKVINNLTVNNETLDLKGRFAVDYQYNAGSQIRFMWRSSSSNAYQHGLAGQWNGNGTADPEGAARFSILNLKGGDKVTLTYAKQSGRAADPYTCAANAITVGDNAVAVDQALVSGTEYTVVADGNLDLYFINNNFAISKVVIKTTGNENVSAPTVSITGAGGASRIVTITAGTSDAGSNVTTYYTIDGTTPTTSSASFTETSKEITVGEGITSETDVTIKAISISSLGTNSEEATQQVTVGTVIKLAAPEINFSDMVEVDGKYYKQYVFAANATGTFNNPVIELSATINGSAILSPYTNNVPGTISVTASAEGYETSDAATLNVDGTVYLLKKEYNFADDNYREGLSVEGNNITIAGTGVQVYRVYDADYIDGITLSNTNFGFTKAQNYDNCKGLAPRWGRGSITINEWSNGDFATLREYVENSIYATTEDGVFSFGGQINYNTFTELKVYNAIEQITIPDYEHGYASYVTTSALDFSGVEGLKAYIGVDEGEYKLKLREVEEVPAGTPIIVKGTRNTTYDIPVGTCTDEITDNLLQGSATETHTVGANESIYALKVSDGKLHSVNAGVVIPAKKAYLVSGYGGSSSAKAITLELVDDEEEATSVVAVAADEANGAAKLYNAAGQQVGAGYNGIVIDQNGNKYVK